MSLTDEGNLQSMVKVGNLLGVLLALGALGMLARYAVLLNQAIIQGQPRLIG